jgi:hypothetical protein
MPRACDSIVISLCLFAFVISFGCSPGIINKSELLGQQLKFLEIGKTTEEETIARMGTPSNRYEGETVWIYSLREDTKHQLHLASDITEGDKVVSLAPGIYRLILVFDANHILGRHSLLYFSDR